MYVLYIPHTLPSNQFFQRMKMMFSQTRTKNIPEITQQNYLQSVRYVRTQQKINQAQTRMGLFQTTKGCSSCGK
jgi:hypothetical protein